MSRISNMALIEEMMQRLSQHDIDGVCELCTPDAAFHGWAPETLDIDGYRAKMSALLDAFPDSRFPIRRLVAEKDRIVNHHRFQGTHRAKYQGVPASGKAVDIEAIAVFRIAGDRVAEIWLSADSFGMLLQMGAIPSREPVTA